MSSKPLRILVLGGTGDAMKLAESLAQEMRTNAANLSVVYSVAGRTERPRLPQAPIVCRMGGFGGEDGLADYLHRHMIDILIDATHPFAAQISANAAIACAREDVTLLAIRRPAWERHKADRWQMAPDMEAAARYMGRQEATNVFLTIGQLELEPFCTYAPQHHYIIRSIEPLPAELTPPDYESILERGPFALPRERALLESRNIRYLVTKNSGGGATAAKLLAARELGIEVVMVERPKTAHVDEEVQTAAEAMRFIQRRLAQ